MSNLDKTPESLARVAKEGPHLREDFKRASTGAEPAKREQPEPRVGAEQVEQDAPELILRPPPGMTHEVDRAAHYGAAARDDARARERYNQATKDAFLERAAREQKQEPKRDTDRDRGREGLARIPHQGWLHSDRWSRGACALDDARSHGSGALSSAARHPDSGR